MIHAVFPGSFDPLHNGHLDVIRRASAFCDRLTVAVLHNPLKDKALFSVEERLAIVEAAVGDLPAVGAERFEGLLVDYLERRGARLVVKSLRSVADFENERQMAQLNRGLRPEIDTVFLMSEARWSFVSSTRVKEIARYGGEVAALVPEASLEALRGKFGGGARR